jgi:hypothetical protein
MIRINMTHFGSKAVRFLFFIVLIFYPVNSSLAVLGEDRKSVEADLHVFAGEKESTVRKGYSVEIVKGSIWTLQEYVDSQGKVFAVSWRGRGVPDLETLLGRYFPEYQSGLAERRKNPSLRRAPIQLKTDHLVIETGGKHRDLWGRIYLPAFIPDGVTEREIH